MKFIVDLGEADLKRTSFANKQENFQCALGTDFFEKLSPNVVSGHLIGEQNKFFFLKP